MSTTGIDSTPRARAAQAALDGYKPAIVGAIRSDWRVFDPDADDPYNALRRQLQDTVGALGLPAYVAVAVSRIISTLADVGQPLAWEVGRIIGEVEVMGAGE